MFSLNNTPALNQLSAHFVSERKHPWLSQNLTNQDVNSSSTLVLTCFASGVPHPLIRWYKNGVEVEESPGILQKNKTLIDIIYMFFFYFKVLIQRKLVHANFLYRSVICGCNTISAAESAIIWMLGTMLFILKCNNHLKACVLQGSR